MMILERKRISMLSTLLAFGVLLGSTESFAPIPFVGGRNGNVLSQYPSATTITMNKPRVNMYMASGTDESETTDDETLLKEVTIAQLQSLCADTNLSTKGTKEEMLLRLRKFAQKQAKLDQERLQKQKERIEVGMDEQGNGKAKHKISNADIIDDDNDDDLGGVFYFSIPGEVPASQNKTLARVTTTSINPQNDPGNCITAPKPPPDAKVNEDGEQVVTVYSSTDQNDLTGIAASKSSTSGNEVAMAGGYSRSDTMGATTDNPENTLAGGPFGDQSGSQRKKTTGKELERAQGVISDLVFSLLSMTGAPGFQEEFADGVTPFLTDGEKEEFESSSKSGDGVDSAKVAFVGFDPSRVPTQLITQGSTSLRAGNGDALRNVLNDFEMQAIGYDGIHGDDKEKGGGHYLEVQKVGTFLEGFRKAEVRRIARETATMLLDQLVTGGVRGLDQMLMTMTKGGDDTNESGELNDSLVKYLEVAVRDQEMKVEQMFGSQGVMAREAVGAMREDDQDDKLSRLWNVTTEEDGTVVESLDPNDPEVRMALEEELRADAAKTTTSTPVDPAKQLLTLLTLLRERVKAEAVFSNDEKGRNLRTLAYCLHAENEKEREKIIVDSMGNALEQLDCFSELLTSSIDYAESTTHQLQPAKSGPLNIRLLKNIKEIVEEVKERQAWKASGVSSWEQNRPFS